jgi:tetratricopeptide (TPR) repeat protein
MKYCQYHPLIPAAYKCDYCQTSQCDYCVDDSVQGKHYSCFICRNEVESLGARYSAYPFWRRFQEIFRYPLKTETIVFIVGMAILNIVIEFLPFTIIWFLILLGIFMKYCFSCLEKTAKGSLIPPNITSAYDGGIVLASKLIAILFIIGVSIIGIQIWLGTAIAIFFGVLALCCCPAIIINFSLSENVMDAVNPLKILYLISAVGLPYGLLLAIILIMSGSVSFINELISSEASYISLGLQMTVSNYYTIVIFHLMGYMLFQYQGQLGFIARQEEEVTKPVRSAIECTLANIEVHVKEGYYDEALMMFQEGLKKHGKNKILHDKCLELLLATKNLSTIDAFAPIYFKFLADNQAKDQLTLVYKKILKIYPKFIPKAPEDKLLLAQEFQASGDSLSALRLLNGLHKSSPDFNHLIIAMELMLDALRNLPNLREKAEEFDIFVKRFKQQKELDRAKPRVRIKPKASVESTGSSKPHTPIKPRLLETSLRLEEQIKNNAEKSNPKKTPNITTIAADNKIEP